MFPIIVFGLGIDLIVDLAWYWLIDCLFESFDDIHDTFLYIIPKCQKLFYPFWGRYNQLRQRQPLHPGAIARTST